MSRNKDDNQCAGKWGPRPSENLDPNRKWAAVRRRYEWDDSYDDEAVAPRDEELEQELFGEENHIHTGLNFAKYDKIKVTVNGSREINPINTFEEANLHSAMKENVKLARYTVPTPVQKYSIPIITEGLDLMACAQTGSGKTAAFLIPILSKVFTAKRSTRQTASARRYKVEPLVLILAPTRELATQIFDECRRFTYRSMMRPCVVYGGAEAGPQRAELTKGCDVLAATPGRLSDFIDRGVLSLRKVRYLVLDEADRMLDMGFEGDIRKIVQKSDLLDDGSRQTMMFSATFPENIQRLARDFLKNDYLFLTVGRIGGTTSDITQRIEYVEEKKKRTKLVELLLKQPPSRTLIFVETKRGADSLDDYLYHQNFPTTSIHGDRTQREREDALMSFKNGRSPILIATAVAARGLDIKNVMHVINYDLCNDIDEYVHRIGRTARVGNEGLATTFYNEKNSEIASDLVKLLTECKQEVPEFLQSYMPSNTTFDDDKIGGSSSRYRNRNDDKNDNDNWNKNDNWDKNDSWNKNDNSYNNNNNNSNNSNNNHSWDSNPTQSQQLPPPLQPQQTSIQPQLQQRSQYPQQSQYQHQPQATNDSWQNTASIPHQQSSFPPQPPIQSFQQQSHSQQNNLQPQPQYNQSQYVSQPSYNNTQPPRIFSPQPQQPISQYGGSAPPPPQQSMMGQQPNPNNNQIPPPPQQQQQQNYGYNSSPQQQQQQQSQPYQQIPPPQQPQLFTNFGVSPNNGYNY